jgi:hypothetical protein
VSFEEKNFMTSEECRLLIPQYLSGRLTPVEQGLFEAELSTSADLRLEVEELRSLWEGLGGLPEEHPSVALRARFYQRLNEINNARSSPARGGFAWWKPGLSGLVRQATMALALVALGVYVGRGNRSGPASTAEVQQLQGQVQNLRQTVALSLLDRQSATSRLEGISWSSQVQRPDDQLMAALLRTLNHDPNVNVRLSSLDALEKFSGDAAVRKALVASLSIQDSPLVQIALIDALVHARDNGAATELKKLTTDSDMNAAVRQRAQWGLQRLGL